MGSPHASTHDDEKQEEEEGDSATQNEEDDDDGNGEDCIGGGINTQNGGRGVKTKIGM